MAMRSIAICMIALMGATVANGVPPAQALTMKECSAKYKAAQQAGTLQGMTWRNFQKTECAASGSAAALPPAADSSSKSIAAPRASLSKSGNAIFPTAVSPKYSNEAPGKARMRTCLDQYHANKINNSNGGLSWIQKGGGYYSQCNKRLKG